jgi:hypothetical protein
VESVHGDRIASVSGLFSGGIRNRPQRCVEVLSVAAESKTDEVTLVSFFGQAFFRKIRNPGRLQIDDRDRLMPTIFLRAIPSVKHGGVAPIGTDGNRRRKAVEPAKPPRNRREGLAGRQSDARSGGGLLGEKQTGQEDEGKNSNDRKLHNSFLGITVGRARCKREAGQNL